MTLPLIVLVPVLDRPKSVEPLIDSFVTSNTPGELWFVATDSDTKEVEALERSGAKYLLTPSVSWPRKINEAYQFARTQADWVLFGADDIRFHDGWFENTKPFRDQPEICVIGTNDLGNPRVIAGDHATHPLVRSSYIGTIDDPDAIVHTGYRHTFVDDEFCWTAKLRGAWAHCPTAVVEHMHPFWHEAGKAKGSWDATYSQGDLSMKQDRRLWVKRAPLLGLEVRFA